MNYYAVYSTVTGEFLGATGAEPNLGYSQNVAVIHVPEGIDFSKMRWDVPSRSFKPVDKPAVEWDEDSHGL